jgi:hypothetical protein
MRSAAPVRRGTVVRGAVVLTAVAALALVAIPAALAAFAAGTQSSANVVKAVPDFTAPAVTAIAVGKAGGGVTGFVKQGGSYYAYANVALDTGNPASGIASVKSNLEALTAGQTAVPMESGSFPAGGITYNYRAGPLIAANPLAAGAKSFSVTSADVAGNTKTVAGSVSVDNTPPQAADLQTTNAGSNGLAEQNDTVAFTASEPIEPESIISPWNGTTPTNVVVRIYDNGLLGLAGDDELVVYNSTNTTELPLGKVDLGRGDYVAGVLGGQITFGASGTASKMTMSGNTVTIVLGTYAAVGLVVSRTTAAATGTMIWTPVATPFDRAGNVMSTTPVSETGALDRDF